MRRILRLLVQSTFSLFTCAYLLVPLCAPNDQPRPPNVILIITDDQGYGDVGLHDNDKIRTPNLDRLGVESVRLMKFYVSPVCSPTRASLMTGRYNYRTGVVDTFLGRSLMYTEEVTIAEMLGARGYRTGIFGKWHLGDNYPLRAIDQGFQEALVHTGGGIGQPSDPEGNSYFDPILRHNGSTEKHRGYCTDIFTDAAIRFIEDNRGQPFFVYLATNAPHTPLQIDDSYVAPYRDLGLADEVAKVYGMVTNIDENVGRLLDRVDALGLRENTIFLFMTDNGPGLVRQERYNSGMRGAKGSIYEGGIRVPMFIRWPAKLGAGEVDRIAAHIDIAPTLLDACGVEKPENVSFDGRSLMPLLLAVSTGETVDWPERTLFFQWHRGDQPERFRNSAVRTDRYKLANGVELYDLVQDPREAQDIAPDHPDLVAQLRLQYEKWFTDVSATRGYAPPRIRIGTEQENPVTLTPQDWRGPLAGWSDDSLGYWEVAVIRPAAYRITMRFLRGIGARTLHFRLGDTSLRQAVPEESTSFTFDPVPLAAASGRLEAWVEAGTAKQGVQYVIVEQATSGR